MSRLLAVTTPPAGHVAGFGVVISLKHGDPSYKKAEVRDTWKLFTHLYAVVAWDSLSVPG